MGAPSTGSEIPEVIIQARESLSRAQGRKARRNLTPSCCDEASQNRAISALTSKNNAPGLCLQSSPSSVALRGPAH